MENINIPQFDNSNIQHNKLVELSKEAHKYYSDKKKNIEIEKHIDIIVKKIILGD